MNIEPIRKRFNFPLAILVLAVIAAAAGASFLARNVVSAQQRAQLPSPADLSRAFIEVARTVKPVVVSIDTVEKAKPSASRRGVPLIPGLPPFDDQPRRQRGTGSGVIVSPDGYILTNNHVAGEAAAITVQLTDGREFKARRVGTDPETDLAVIKIDANSLPYAKLGDSDRLEQGEWVLALGSPFGFQQTMTAGIVSATGRDLQGRGVGASQFTNYIQTDASINPGNSGGPLVNMQGEVVGINTLIFSGTGASAGVGFSIPSNLASKVYAQLIDKGKVIRGYLGVLLQPVTPAVARMVGFSGTDGALVQDIATRIGPAAKAGLRSGDVIVEFDGKPVKSPKQLTEMVADTPVGKTVRLKYVREGQPETAMLTLAERPTQVGEEPEPEEEEGSEEPAITSIGIRSRTVTPDIVREWKLKIPTGVIISDLEAGSPAAESGLQRGDVIHRVGRVPITNRQDMARALASFKDEREIVLQIERRGQLLFVTVSLDQ